MKIRKFTALLTAFVFLTALVPFSSVQAVDQTIQYNEEMVGAGHPTKTDTLNRALLVEHNADGTHKVPAAWTTPAFSAGNFTGNASMTWTVAAGDVTTYAYTIIGKMMTVAYDIRTSTVAGTPNTQLLIAIPASKTATKTIYNSGAYAQDNNTYTASLATVSASGTTIAIMRSDLGNWSASTDQTRVTGQITFEIN